MLIVDPTRLYEINAAGSGAQVCPVLSAHLEAAAVFNQTLIAAVTGQRIRVMGWTCGSTTATAGGFALKNGPAGARFHAQFAPANTALPFVMPIADSGYFETSTSTALGLDVGGGSNINITIFYITYTP